MGGVGYDVFWFVKICVVFIKCVVKSGCNVVWIKNCVESGILGLFEVFEIDLDI